MPHDNRPRRVLIGVLDRGAQLLRVFGDATLLDGTLAFLEGARVLVEGFGALLGAEMTPRAGLHFFAAAGFVMIITRLAVTGEMDLIPVEGFI